MTDLSQKEAVNDAFRGKSFGDAPPHANLVRGFGDWGGHDCSECGVKCPSVPDGTPRDPFTHRKTTAMASGRVAPYVLGRPRFEVLEDVHAPC